MRRRRRPVVCDCPESSPIRPDLGRLTVAVPCRDCSGVMFTLGPGDLEEVITKLTELRDTIAHKTGRDRLPEITRTPEGRTMFRWPDGAVSWAENG